MLFSKRWFWFRCTVGLWSRETACTSHSLQTEIEKWRLMKCLTGFLVHSFHPSSNQLNGSRPWATPFCYIYQKCKPHIQTHLENTLCFLFIALKVISVNGSALETYFLWVDEVLPWPRNWDNFHTHLTARVPGHAGAGGCVSGTPGWYDSPHKISPLTQLEWPHKGWALSSLAVVRKSRLLHYELLGEIISGMIGHMHALQGIHLLLRFRILPCELYLRMLRSPLRATWTHCGIKLEVKQKES